VAGEAVGNGVDSLRGIPCKHGASKPVGPQRAGNERVQLRRIGRSEVEDVHDQGFLVLDEVHVPEFPLDHHGLSRVLGRHRHQRVGVHHVHGIVVHDDGGAGKGEDLDTRDLPE
jgi:hypothetical protein